MLSNLIKMHRVCFILCITSLTWHSYAYALVDKKVPPVDFFVDRAYETQTIFNNLRSYKVVSIVGVTYMGKTEMARKYASFNQKEYDLIWFFDSSIDLNEQFIALAKKINQSKLIGDNNKLSEEADSSQHEVMEFLTAKENWLLVFDNLRLNQNDKIQSIIDWQHNGHIIICSQDSKNLPNIIYVHKLDDENSLLLLQKIFGQGFNKEFLEKLIEIFNGYPGPLVQGAMLLKEHNYLSIDEYKSILAKSWIQIASAIFNKLRLIFQIRINYLLLVC